MNSNSINEKNGIIAVNKPQEWTSFDVIGKLRGVLKIKRLGHAGTLDPLATGVLPVFVGKATKACDIIPDRKKVYTAGFKLGVVTDTLDITGNVLKECESHVTGTQLENAKTKFEGDIFQLPPMYSAVKVDGKRLYELAREGKVVERKARPCHIDSIEILDFDEKSQQGKMTVSCEKGTYIRTVINDIGEALGTGGVMTSLVRTYSGGCDISQCYTIEEIAEICNEDRLDEIIMPVDKAFEIYDKIVLNKRVTALYKNGVKLYPQQTGVELSDKLYRVYGFDGEFLGTGHFVDELFRSHKNFYTN